MLQAHWIFWMGSIGMLVNAMCRQSIGGQGHGVGPSATIPIHFLACQSASLHALEWLLLCDFCGSECLPRAWEWPLCDELNDGRTEP